jgi:hypothetical protein
MQDLIAILESIVAFSFVVVDSDLACQYCVFVVLWWVGLELFDESGE